MYTQLIRIAKNQHRDKVDPLTEKRMQTLVFCDETVAAVSLFYLTPKGNYPKKKINY